MRTVKGCIAFASTAILFASSPAKAGTATTTFPVSATVLSTCLIVALPLAFGNYDPTSSSDLDASTSFTVLCTLGTSYTVGLNQGTASGATVTTRAMTNGGSTLNYALYQDVGRATNWGNSAGVDTPSASVAGLLPKLFNVYGRIPHGQNASPGLYQDTVTITVNY